jgi:Cys-rich repeat protein
MALVLAACPEDQPAVVADEPAGDAAAEPEPATGSSDGGAAAELHGWFTVKLVPQMAATPVRDATDARTAVTGKLGDGETPEATIWSVSEQEGDCELLTPRVPFCDPDCGGTALCVDDGVCGSYPHALGVGTVRAIGLGDEFSMRPIAGNYQPPAGTVLDYPPCEQGAEIRLEAEGDAYEPFSLAAPCIAPMEFSGPVRIEPGEPLVLEWTAAAQPDLARIHIGLDISHHGGSRGKIECDVADTGSARIPAQLLQQLIDLGVAGFPSVIVTRIVTGNGSTAQAERVTLTVSSSLENQVQIPGLSSCTADSHCPSGQTCRIDLTCS